MSGCLHIRANAMGGRITTALMSDRFEASAEHVCGMRGCSVVSRSDMRLDEADGSERMQM